MISKHKSAFRWAVLLLALCALAALDDTAGNATPAVSEAYQKSFNQWKAELVTSRRQNWLTLVGLFWLKEGANDFGSDASNRIVLPASSVPAHAGNFTLHGGEVTLQMSGASKAEIDGNTVTTATLQSDETEKPTVISLGSLRMHVIKRGSRLGIRVKDPNNPAAKSYAGPVFYPLNMDYRVIAKWLPADGKQTVNVPDVLGDTTPVPIAGTAVFQINGHEYRLTDIGGDSSKGLFFVFNDLTKKTETYPGGRFLETDPVKNGTVVIDFNYAYNPPCSVTPYATCPLAPPENRLAVAVPAGEKYDKQHSYHHGE
jgi:uncharacterized protein (DUF1684 family)